MWPFCKKQTHVTFGEIKHSSRKGCWRGKYSFPDTGDWVDATVIIPGGEEGPRDVTDWWPEFLSCLPELRAEAERFLKQEIDNVAPRHRKRVAEALDTFTAEECRVHSLGIPGPAPDASWFIEWAYPLASPRDAVKSPDIERPKMYGLLKFEYQGRTVCRMIVPG